MKQLIIIFEFGSGSALRISPFVDMIRKYGNFAFLTKNSCIIWTTATVVAVRDHLMTGMSSGDKLFVSEISAPAAWTGIGKEVSEYIVKNLKDI